MNVRDVPWWGSVSSAAPPVVLAAGGLWPHRFNRGPTVRWPTWSAPWLAWFGLELLASAGQAGLAERVLGEAQAGWPFVVVMACRHPAMPTVRYRLLHGYR